MIVHAKNPRGVQVREGRIPMDHARSRLAARGISSVETSDGVAELTLRFTGTEGQELMRRINESKESGKLSVVVYVSPTPETGSTQGGSAPAAAVNSVSTPPALANPESPITVGPLTIVPHRHEALWNGKPIPALTRTQFGILSLLARHPGWVFSRDRIVALVQGSDYGVTTRAVDVQVVNLRKKLGKAADCIETVRGVGYRLRDLRGES